MLQYLDVTRPPDDVYFQANSEWASGEWRQDTCQSGPFQAGFERRGQGLCVTLSADKPIARVALRWRMNVNGPVQVLGDHWERGYGDLFWGPIAPDRDMPWYFLYSDTARTHGAGVMTGPAAICYWRLDAFCVTLVLDVRCGGGEVDLSRRGSVRLATIVTRQGEEGENAFAAAQAFCRMLCPVDRTPKQPVYGGNDWYFSYGKSSHSLILDNASMLSDLSEHPTNRPSYVIDMNWHSRYSDWWQRDADPWTQDNPNFPDMPGLADAMKQKGVRPGLWFRPLLTSQKTPKGLLLSTNRAIGKGADGLILDPSREETLEMIMGYVQRFTAWGYQMLKHDFSTYDLLGQWGFQKPGFTQDGWTFGDTTRTTAEIVLALYGAIRHAAGDAQLIGCNTLSHLAAGLVELQRTGDDTSGREWERTRKMGVNTMAFRLPQHGTFYAADADCVAFTQNAPRRLTHQWLELVARSGTPLFISADAAVMDAENRRAVREAFSIASQPQPCAQPLDWQYNITPSQWRFGEDERTFDWAQYGRVDYCGL